MEISMSDIGATLAKHGATLATLKERSFHQTKQLDRILEHQIEQNGALSSVVARQDVAEIRLTRLEEHDAAQVNKPANSPPSVKEIIRWTLSAVALGASIALGYNLPKLLELLEFLK